MILKTLSTLILIAISSIPLFTEEKPLIKISSIGFPPYGMEKDGKRYGIYYDFAERIAKEIGYKSQNDVTTYARIKKQLIFGQVDMTIMFKYGDLDQHVSYVAALPSLKVVVLSLRDKPIVSLKSLKGKRLAYLRGAKFSSKIDQDPEIKIYRTVSIDQGVKMLFAQRVDAVIGPIDPILSSAYCLNKCQDDFAKALLVSERTPWLQISNKSLDHISIAEVKKAFVKLQKLGVLNELRKKYLKTKKTPMKKTAPLNHTKLPADNASPENP